MNPVLYRGVYKNKVDKSSFVFRVKGEELYLRLNNTKEIILKGIGEHEFKSENDDFRVKFIINHRGIPHSVIVSTSEKEYLAHRKMILLPSLRIGEFKAFSIALVAILLCAGYFLYSSKILHNLIGPQLTNNSKDLLKNRINGVNNRAEKLREKLNNRLTDQCSGSFGNCFKYIKLNYFKERSNIDKVYSILEKNCTEENRLEFCRLHAEILMNEGQVDDSLNKYNDLCNSDDFVSCRILGLRLLKEKKFVQAEKFLVKACQGKKCEEVGRLLLLEGKFQKAEEYYVSLCGETEDDVICKEKEKITNFITDRNSCEAKRSSQPCLRAANFLFKYQHVKLYRTFLNWVCNNSDVNTLISPGKLCLLLR